jgi:signal transduction histidine kinase
MISTPASSEFIALCRAQLRLLAEGLGASLSVIYMTDELEGSGESKFLPVLVYPETGVVRSQSVGIGNIARSSALATEPSIDLPLNYTVPKQIASNGERNLEKLTPNTSETLPITFPLAANIPSDKRGKGWEESDYQAQRLQILLPLVYDGNILGLLVTTRENQPWGAKEQTEIQHIAQTIALAGIIDRQRNWLTVELQQQQAIQLRQRDLLHNLLHQLRNPLMAIRTFGKLLLRRLQPGDPNQTVATSLLRESIRLQELLEHLETAIDINLVNEDTVERASLQPAPNSNLVSSENLLLPEVVWEIESCHLMDTLTPIIIAAEAIAAERNLKFHAHIPDDLPSIHATPTALREVLSNLIDNALKYTPAGGEVHVDIELQLKQKPPMLQICIRDTGMGIPGEDIKKLFTRHYRGIQAQGSIKGTGLGLAIAKELIDRMQGKIAVASPPPGGDRGTEFTLWLLLAS